MRDIQLLELAYVTGGECSAIPTKQELEMDSRAYGVAGGFAGAFTGFCGGVVVGSANALSLTKQGLLGLVASPVGAALGYSCFYGLNYAIGAHIYQI